MVERLMALGKCGEDPAEDAKSVVAGVLESVDAS
jgi:hypothetical protein